MPLGVFDRSEGSLWLKRIREAAQRPEHRAKISAITTKFYVDHPEVKIKSGIKISEKRTGKRYPNACGPKKYVVWNKGLTKETDERVRKYTLKNIGMPNPLPENIKKKRLKDKEIKFNIDKDKLIQLYITEIRTMEEISEITKIPSNRVNDFLKRYNITKRTHRETMLLRPDLLKIWYENTSRAARETQTELRKDPKFIDKLISSIRRSPNKLEIYFEKLMISENLPYKYIGDGQQLFGHKSPDYINTNGENKLIELFGDYWHRNDNSQDRIDHFKKYNFDTLIIWKHELRSNPLSVIEKIKSF
jgi:hypothetical protein